MSAQIDPTILVTWVLSIGAIVVALLIYYWQRQFARFQHLTGGLNKAQRILREISNSASTARLLKDSTIELHKYFQDPNLTVPSFLNMRIFEYFHAIHSTLRLNQNCVEFLDFFEVSRKEGVTEGIRRLDWSLHGLLLKMKDASEEFLKIDIRPLAKNVNLFIEKYHENESLLDQIYEKIGELEELSNKCLSGISKLPL